MVIQSTPELVSIMLQNLGQLLSLKLEYLNLIFDIKYKNDFEIFLKNSQNTFIKKLLINNSETFINYSNIDLFSLKDEVKEFELYNIKIQKYRDLVIDSIEKLEDF
ncbi:hypothetical protein RhiirA1_449805 [Rhizophagus irregularis]|uniref:Uncharacterized protein n=1 Tax=Rhizophagus irregularis TaxID=588596 RepID=A0A2N0SGA5_9GLOM|nr:hypothetical protein RhiirA1_449805 [Rhizophagus irregularis]